MMHSDAIEGCLVVRAGGHRYGLRLEQVLEVIDGLEVSEALRVHESVRGITQLRDSSMPVVNLAALLSGTEVPGEVSGTAVLANCLGSPVAFEVDDAEAIAGDESVDVPDGWRSPWVKGVVRFDGSLIPVADLDVLGERLMVGGEREVE